MNIENATHKSPPLGPCNTLLSCQKKVNHLLAGVIHNFIKLAKKQILGKEIPAYTNAVDAGSGGQACL
jgi:hypothetical protein